MIENPFPATGMPDRQWWAILWPDAKGMIRQLGIEPGMTVVDLCCGDGYFTAPLAELVNGHVYAIDLDPEMLQRARSEVEQRNVTVRQWFCADARNIAELVPQDNDFVFMANTFHGVPDKTALAKEVARVLRPGGRFAIVNWYPLAREQTTVLGEPRGPKTEMRMSPEQVQAIVEPAGFQLTNVVELAPYHYGAVFLKPLLVKAASATEE